MDVNVKKIERHLEELINKMNKERNNLDVCLEYIKLFESVTYLEYCGYLELPSHKNDTFHLYKDYCTIARIRTNK